MTKVAVDKEELGVSKEVYALQQMQIKSLQARNAQLTMLLEIIKGICTTENEYALHRFYDIYKLMEGFEGE